MMCGNEDNLYRFEEVEMLAYKVCRIFYNKGAQQSMNNVANQRHNQLENALSLISIYNQIKTKQ